MAKGPKVLNAVANAMNKKARGPKAAKAPEGSPAEEATESPMQEAAEQGAPHMQDLEHHLNNAHAAFHAMKAKKMAPSGK